MQVDWAKVKEIISNGWIIGPMVFIVWLTAAYIMKKVAYRALGHVSKKHHHDWRDLLFSTINIPMQLFIVFLGLIFMEKFLPIKEKTAGYLQYSMHILLIVIAIILVDRIARVTLIVIDMKGHAVRLSQSVVQGVIRGVILLIGLLILLGSLGVNITPLLASLGVTSLAVALALQGTLANLFSGFFLTMDRSIKVGDLVELENGERGYVEDIGWRSSQIRLRSDSIEIIPNSRLVESTVKNYTNPDAWMRIYIRCGVHYESDLRKVQEVAVGVAKDVKSRLDLVDKNFEPWLRFEEFDDSSINFCVVMRVKDYVSSLKVTSEVIICLHEKFREEGIVIPFPMRTLDIQPRHQKLLENLAGEDAPHVD